MSAYAELAVTTNFSFLRGASFPQEMVKQAQVYGLTGIGIADRNSFAGVVRALAEARKHPALRYLPGVRLVTTDGFEAIAYPTDRAAYGRLCRLLSENNERIPRQKGECRFGFEAILGASEGQMLIAMPPDVPTADFIPKLAALAEAAPGRAYLAGCHRHRGDEPRRLGLLAELGDRLGAPMIAVNDVLYHEPDRQALADILTCIREKCTLAEAGHKLEINRERHLKPAGEMARLFAAFPEALARTLDVVKACSFDLRDLRYEYPDEPIPPGKSAQGHLEDLAWEGAQLRYPGGVPEKVSRLVRAELALIAKLAFAPYFLTVHDIVAYARNDLKILCQGRGSAANSAVCYCLGITEVNPDETDLLFSRFISEKRGEPPDIDVDFEHERREEVIQYIYARYGRHRAAICATVIHYRSRRAVGEVGKVLGLTPDVTAALSKTVWGMGTQKWTHERVRQAGLDPGNPVIRQALHFTAELTGFPRHLSQHVGGFVLTRERLNDTVPVCNATMEERTFIEWDKDDIDTLGLMKVDVLALGMLSCIRRGLDLLRQHYDRNLGAIAALPRKDKPTYDMLCEADSVGVFQVESRAQMSMLPRLRPQKFYDLVIEVAIVRPGPIQGDMVHPYLRRRDGIEKPELPFPRGGSKNELEEVLGRTLGVPLFQEQAMEIAIRAAGFTPDDADGLRRAMATFRHNGTIGKYKAMFIEGMVGRGYERAFAERCFSQIEGFGEYGFPESHAASFAVLVYVSAYIKCHYPDVFCAAILNSQPMGFYQPAQLVRDAVKHGVEVREVDVNSSDWDCTLEPASPESPHRFAVRLGFRLVKGVKQADFVTMLGRRGNGYGSLERLASAGGLSHTALERLAEADAFRSLGLDRRSALWAVRRFATIGIGLQKTGRDLPLLAPHLDDDLFPEPGIRLPAMALGEHVLEDYHATSLSLKAHPCAFLRPDLARRGAITNREHRSEVLAQDSIVVVAGLVLTRQRPGTASGVVFMTIEDETDISNIIVWPKVFERYRRIVMTSRLVAIRGRLQRAGIVVHVIAEDLVDLSAEISRLRDRDGPPPAQLELGLFKSRDFH
ncbi:error-prone DNA polymerase [Labrys monachus]|uniref:Error-prone DNA polymerase n=1 Tax=Labrys monachus TaxID=217067 RepID=A0ABU0FIP5_9HYPH|nr:error-prone DNA polymerase [Labrys monachus]MDQ0394483.1 error-prone DNA polymerase [Labrys monachus]